MGWRFCTVTKRWANQWWRSPRASAAPSTGNAAWRDLRDNRPEEWADAVEFDAQIRKGGARGEPIRGEQFLHRSRRPLSEAPIDHVTRGEWDDRQVDLFDLIPDVNELGDPDGCSPYGCRNGDPVG